jgi:hypothetical protein
MIPLIISAIVLLTAGGTVAASDDAKPGDLLFPIDRATERVQIAFAGQEKKVKLKTKFARERMSEVAELLAESESVEVDTDDNATSTDDNASTTPTSTSTSTATSTASSTDGVAKINKKSDIEKGLALAIDLISQLENSSEYSSLTEELNSLVAIVPENTNIQVKVSEQGAQFLKVRSDDGSNKLNLEVKETGGGMVIIKSRDAEGKMSVTQENKNVPVQNKWENNPGVGNKKKVDLDKGTTTASTTATSTATSTDDGTDEDDSTTTSKGNKPDKDKSNNGKKPVDDETDDSATSTDN